MVATAKKPVQETAPMHEETIRMQAAVNNAMTPIMMVDRDFIVTYVNQATIDLLRKHESLLQSLYRGFSADRVLGTCIDTFHKTPERQRRLLADPKNMPYSTDIQIGPLTFRLNVTAIADPAGKYIGNTLEWNEITEMRKKEGEVVRLQRALDGAMTPFMMVDRELVITYANDATIALLKKHEEALRALYRSFSVDKLLGTCIDIFHAKPEHQRRLLADPNNLPYSTDIKVGPLTFNINVSAIFDQNDAYVGNSLEWQDVTDVRKKQSEAARLQTALDGAMTSFMMVDRNFTITYANKSTLRMLKKHEDALRSLYTGFSVEKIIGMNIDTFHKHPEHQRRLLDDPRNLPYTTNIQVGPLSFSLNVTALLDAEGQYVGNALEWSDITEQMDAQQQVERLISNAVAGKLDERIKADRYEGFMRKLSEGVNTMLDTVVQPIQETTRVIASLAQGDLTLNMAGEFQGEFAVLRDAVNDSMQNLLNMVNDIRQAGANISSAAAEIAQGNTDLSQRTQEQAASLEETASSIEELTSTVKQNADNARQANQLAYGAREQAEKGGEVVGKAVDAMAEINNSSKKIADIIGVIDGIAFQTNLLALNAAVEAARAGEQGRGFAVVAAEVRNLAQRSAAAAKEIKALINDSVEKIVDGSRLVDESGKTLTEIVAAVKKVSDIIAEIAAASQEQSSGIEQVNKAITQMDEVTQQNAALVEEAAAASESLDEQAKGLDQLMSFFKTEEEEDYTGPAMSQANKGRTNGMPSRPGRAAGATNGARREPAPAAGRSGRMPAAKAQGASEPAAARPTRSGLTRANGHADVAARSNGHGRATAVKGGDDEWSEF